MKKRLDQHLADEGYFESRARARAAVMEGLVSVDGNRDVKPGTQVTGAEQFSVDEHRAPFVSRGGTKLDGALDDLGIDVKDLLALDVGASTGGFTDCLLQRGAKAVAAIDVGKGQLHWKLRQDERVTVIEGLNARGLTEADLPWRPDIAAVDVSFISLRKVLGPVASVLKPGGSVLALVKPQFEAGVGKAPKGVVKDEAVVFEVLVSLRDWIVTRQMSVSAVAPSRIRGPKGNAEYFFLVETESRKSVSDKALHEALRRAPSR